MSEASTAMFVKAAFGLTLIGCSILLIIFGAVAFFRGTGIEKLKQHTFRVEMAEFKLNAIVSSAGAIMLLASLPFGYWGYRSAPIYEASLFGTSTKVSMVEPTAPLIGSSVFTASGDQIKIQNVDSTISLIDAAGWTPTASLAGNKEFSAGVLKAVQAYSDCQANSVMPNLVLSLKGSPETNGNSKEVAADAAKVLVSILKNAGVDAEKVAYDFQKAETSLKSAPSISFVNTAKRCNPKFN